MHQAAHQEEVLPKEEEALQEEAPREEVPQAEEHQEEEPLVEDLQEEDNHLHSRPKRHNQYKRDRDMNLYVERKSKNSAETRQTPRSS